MVATKSKLSPADEWWGYRFGADGVTSSKDARERLGNVCDRTLRRYRDKKLIRMGYRIPGVPSSGVVICTRSLNNHLSNCER